MLDDDAPAERRRAQGARQRRPAGAHEAHASRTESTPAARAAAAMAVSDPRSADVPADMDFDFVIDGGEGEGGGQLLRNPFALASILHRSVKVVNVRANRARPGLQPQHLAGLRCVADLHGAMVRGGRVGCMTVAYVPGTQAPAGESFVDIGTAGSIGLIFQATLPCLVFAAAPTVLRVRGGTNLMHAPTVAYLRDVFMPVARIMGVHAEIELHQFGFYPRGGGEATIRVTPTRTLNPIVLDTDRGAIAALQIHAFSSRLPNHVRQREEQAAYDALRDAIRPWPGSDAVERETFDVANSSTHIGTWVECTARMASGCLLRGTAIGERNRSAEEVGKEAAACLARDLEQGGSVDEYLQDQLIVFMALAAGQSRVRVGEVSLHTLTAINVVQRMTGAKFEIIPASEGRPAVIVCDGIGFVNPNIAAN